ncbi:hypothetical protein [Luteimicrobium album]|uniref:hypothetical protein n=1 Tax=Luteimicrobium album TaxID=1054550 RepID=UPI0024E0B8EF|nr:hypothetical protein [Luteimicrobium album]
MVRGPCSALVPPHTAGPRTVAVLGVLVLLGAAVLAAQAALVAWGALSGSWVVEAARWADGRDARGRVPLLTGVCCVVLGVGVVVACARRRRHLSVLLHVPALYLEPQDVARVASRAASEVGGVLDASSSASSRQVVVHVTSLDPAAVRADVERAVVGRLAALTAVPAVEVRAGRRDRSRVQRHAVVLEQGDVTGVRR